MSLKHTLKLDKEVIRGWPWHGPVTYDATVTGVPLYGRLTLPNGSTMPFWGEDGIDALSRITPLVGTVRRTKFTGIPSVSRTTDQLTADAAAGRTWRNDVLVYHDVVYGELVELDWLWRDATGERWSVVMSASTQRPNADGTNGFIATLFFNRFGAFGKPALQRGVAVNLSAADCGQDTPALNATAFQNLRLEMWDHTLNGDKALFAVLADTFTINATTSQQVVLTRPIGMLEVEVSGTPLTAAPTVTWTIKKTRAQALGSISILESVGISTSKSWAPSESSVEDTDPGTSLATTVTCAGWIEAIGPDIYRRYGDNGTTTKSGSASGVLLSLYYKPDNTIETLTVDWSYSQSSSASVTAVNSGAYEIHVPGTVPRYQGSISRSYSAECTSTVTSTRIIKRGGVVVSSISASASSTGTTTETWTLDPDLGPVVASAQSTADCSFTTEFGTSTITGGVYPNVVTPFCCMAIAPAVGYGGTVDAIYGGGGDVTMYADTINTTSGSLFDTTVGFSWPLAVPGVWMYTIRAVGFVFFQTTWGPMRYKPIIYPDGTYAQEDDTAGQPPRLFASDNPSTGEITVGRTWRAWV